MYIVRGRGSKNTNKVIKDSTEEANLRKHQQNVIGKILATLCKLRQKDYRRQGLRGHQLTLSKPRTKANGSWV